MLFYLAVLNVPLWSCWSSQLWLKREGTVWCAGSQQREQGCHCHTPHELFGIVLEIG